MKFYFCESCGKRLTEHDIDGGAAKNKKLKGVYCKKCAVGVMTMESLPLSDQEARKVLEAESSRSVSPDHLPRPNRRSSAVGLPTPRGTGATRVQGARRPSVSHPSQSSHVNVVVSAIVAGMVAFGGLMLFSGRGRTPTVKAKPFQKPKDKIRTRGSVKREETPRKAWTPGDRTSVERPGDSVSPRAGAKATSTQDPASADSNPDPKKVAQIDPPEPQNTEPAEAPPKPSAAEVAKTKFGVYLKAFDQAMGQGDPVAACKVAEQANSDPALKVIAKEVASLGQVGLALTAAAASRQQAFKALTDGKERSFQTTKEKFVGKVRTIEADTLRVRVESRINNQVAEFEKRVKLADLKPACRARLMGEKRPVTFDEWMADVIRYIVAKDPEGAERSLKETGTHPLRTHYQFRIDELRLGEAEAAAKRAWEEKISPLLKMAKFSKADARAGQKVLESFRADHGKTAFADSIAKEAKSLEEALQAALGPPRELTLDLGSGVKMEFVLIPAGTFMMGDTVQHEVTLTQGFYLGKYEVTQAQYTQMMRKNPCLIKGPDLPVVRISWKECQDFCRKLREKTGKKARLPTEAEWEYACRAGTTTRFSFGDLDEELDAYGWSTRNSEGKVHPVGQKKPNQFGLYDMHGNVWERVQDYYGNYPTKAVTDPKGPSKSGRRAVRGGSWRRTPESSQSAYRGSDPRGDRGSSDGFRVALSF